MKKYGALAISFVLILFFQNCAPPPQMESPSLGSSGREFKTTPVENFDQMTVLISVVTDAGQMEDTHFYDINLASGVIQTFENAGTVEGGRYCLNQIKLADLKSVLDQAQVCEPLFTEGEFADQVCSQVYERAPYVILKDGSIEFRLGELTNACDVSTDLCGDRAARLKAWSDYFILHVNDPWDGGVHPVLQDCNVAL